MAGCCDPSGYSEAFNRSTAKRSVRSFERSGLDSTASRMVDVLRGQGLEGASVLEVGAGVATAVATMLEEGAAHAVAIELSPNYEATAREFLERRGLQASVDWRTGDFIAMEDELPSADVVFLNRVVCCYPDMPAMIAAAGRTARRDIAVSYPRRNLASRFIVWAVNGWFRIRGNSFRTFIHDPGHIVRRIEEAGFQPVETGTTAIWHWGVWRRVAGDAA